MRYIVLARSIYKLTSPWAPHATLRVPSFSSHGRGFKELLQQVKLIIDDLEPWSPTGAGR